MTKELFMTPKEELYQEKIVTKMCTYFDQHYYRIVYEKNGEEVVDYYPSPTTKLGIIDKGFLSFWRGEIGNREANYRVFESQMLGKRVHHAWETMCNGGAVVYNDWQVPVYDGIELAKIKKKHGEVVILEYQDEIIHIFKLNQFLDIVNPIIIANEFTAYSHKYREAGTIDNIMKIKEGEYAINGYTKVKLEEGLYVVDLKSGKNVYDEAYLQISSYAYMLKEMGIIDKYGPFRGGLILHTQAKNKKGIQGFAGLYRSPKELNRDFADFRHAASLWERKNADKKPITYEFPALYFYDKK